MIKLDNSATICMAQDMIKLNDVATVPGLQHASNLDNIGTFCVTKT